jgi:hypothetical protein
VAFAYLSFAQAVPLLAARLQDSGQVYWNQPNELLNCIIESVRLFQALTGSYKQAMAFPTAANQNYYSLTAQPGSPVANSSTDVEVANNVLAALLEPPLTYPAWTGTGQFTLQQLQAAMQNRLNRFIGDTGRFVAQQTISGPPPPVEIVSLPDGVLDVRRAAWIPIPPVSPPATPAWPLGRLDEWAEQAYLPAAVQNPTQPLSFSVFGVGPLQLRLAPPPSNAGNIDCIFVLSGPTLNLNPSSPVVLGISDDLSPALKWGTLADLLGSDGSSRDYARAAYCEQRYAEFVALARIYPSVLTASINNISCGVGSVFDLDAYQPDWQQTTGQPGFVGMCGRHLACIGQTPDGAYGVGLWTVANMPVTGYIQVSRDQIDPVLDYAQHIASFKMGGAEFEGTVRLYQNLISAGKGQNGRLAAIGFYRDQLYQPARKSEIEVPRMLV